MRAMRWLRPKSLSSLMLLGLVFIAAPLLVAIVNAALQMRRLADTSRELVIEGVSTARSSQDLKSQIESLDRLTQEYQVLLDPSLLKIYREQDEQLTATRLNLTRHLQSRAARQALEAFGELQSSISAAVFANPRSAAAAGGGAQETAADDSDGNGADARTAALKDRFAELSAMADRIAQQSEAEIDAQVAGIQRRTLAAQRLLFWQSTLLLPLTLVAILVVTLAIGRPLGHIDRAISELGAGNYAGPITVSGPTDLERLGHQLEWLRARLLDHAQERSRFLRHMSHELKTPLANIREGTELLMDGAVGELDSNQREVAGILRENSIKLQRMIENLLSFSAWQTSSVGLETSEFRLRPLVKQVLENQQLTLLGQRVRLDVKIEDVTLVADRGKLRLILDNLLSNAIKYSPKGGAIHLAGRTSNGQLVLDVADSGPGIPPEERAHIFDAFYTGRAAKAANVKGTGIGLSVVLEFVSAHGGTVQIVDGEYSGAHFRITMPLGNPSRDTRLRSRDQAHAA
jgi:two-component system, NtrC family, sensor histidine kinase GlrK